VLTHVGPASADDDLADGPAADDARLTRAQMDLEAILKRAARAIDMAKIIDRSSLRLDSGAQRLLDRLV
jgi:hypothetical protein